MRAKARRSVLTVGGLSRWAPASQPAPTPSLEGLTPRQGPGCSSVGKHIGRLPSTAVFSNPFTLWQSSQGKQLSRGKNLLLLGQALRVRLRRERGHGAYSIGSQATQDATLVVTSSPPPQGVHTCRYPPPALPGPCLESRAPFLGQGLSPLKGSAFCLPSGSCLP